MADKAPRYAIASPTSMGVRITPADRQSVHISKNYLLQATSAETNVLNIASSLGCQCLALTKFVAGSPIAAFIKSELRARNIGYEGLDVPQGGPWGYRHQFNIADSGFGARGPRVWNDRAGEVGRMLSIGDFDIERIFGEEGVGILHISGLIAALSPETSAFCSALAKEAAARGSLVTFDLNYRASFWENRETELLEAFHNIASLSDALIGNEEDFQLALGLKGPDTVGKELSAQIGSYQGMIGEAQSAFPNVKYFATTLRRELSANEHLWGAMLSSEGKWHVEDPRPVAVLDRIGGGDGFTGGLLYGIYKGWPADKCLQFGWASGALAVASLDDFATPADEEQLFSIYYGNTRVIR
ncbi:MAG: PfkB family carbohydrate kinase [Oscillospiraceae bacterium]|nr:PfkB family carbohydrate kinase [Oscillospiraceae bacterium]